MLADELRGQKLLKHSQLQVLIPYQNFAELTINSCELGSSAVVTDLQIDQDNKIDWSWPKHLLIIKLF